MNQNGTKIFTASFTGKMYDVEVGMYYFNARWYDLEIGRFVTENPARDGIDWYAYCNNNPVRCTDPDGLDYNGMPSSVQTQLGLPANPTPTIIPSISINQGIENQGSICGMPSSIQSELGLSIKHEEKYVILWSYGKHELLNYKDASGNVNWDSFQNNSNFYKAAKTKYNELIKQDISDKSIIFERIDGVQDLQTTWNQLTEYSKIRSLDFYSHGDENIGPEMVYGGTKSFWDNAAQLNWDESSYASFYGCHTDKFAAKFAASQKVTTYGQIGDASFSQNKFIHIPTMSKSKEKVYLNYFEFGKGLINTNNKGTVHYPANYPGDY